ncbi:thioredoxin-interacting protein isoform X3 [Anarrhichthys ocellatus]|uniref:thioredoxin-interacting protein isoform X3 n=1 Tax=Anarrhichthys ocellatus TaxID=433405 RepID=UPI0012ED3DE7|nr:thioredoxin-interacting protein isoform X3 [Anarrhichthys ocellatus]
MVRSPVNQIKVFVLVFSDPGRSFYCGGDKLSGSVRLEAAQPHRVTGLRVSIAGCAHVEHRGGKNRSSRSQEEEYLKEEEEVRLEEQLSTDSDGYFLLQPDKTYSFKFGFELPAAGRLVSSYKGKFGYVRYSVRAVLDGPTQNALHCEKEFEVEEPLDINRPDLLAPAAASKQKNVTCMFIPDGQVSISARIDRKGFCEGEEININAKFENTCSRIVMPKAAIIAKHSYLAGGRIKVTTSCSSTGRLPLTSLSCFYFQELRQKLSTVRGNHIISNMCDVWQGKTIRVPKLKPSLLGCDIIKVDYALMVSHGNDVATGHVMRFTCTFPAVRN